MKTLAPVLPLLLALAAACQTDSDGRSTEGSTRSSQNPGRLEVSDTAVLAAPTTSKLNALISGACPDRSSAELEQWKEHTKWPVSVRDRVNRVYADYERESNTDPRAMVLPPITAYEPFLALENAIQMESRQFDAVSKALKTRHGSAMAAIRNMK